MMKQAKELQANMAKMQEELLHIEMTGASGGGLVNVTVNGKGMAKSLKISPSLFTDEDKDVLEDLIIAAFNDAITKKDKYVQEKTASMTAGLPLPAGMSLPF